MVCDALPAAGPCAVWYTVGVLAASAVGQVPGLLATADMFFCCSTPAQVSLELGLLLRYGCAPPGRLQGLWHAELQAIMLQHVGSDQDEG